MHLTSSFMIFNLYLSTFGFSKFSFHNNNNNNKQLKLLFKSILFISCIFLFLSFSLFFSISSTKWNIRLKLKCEIINTIWIGSYVKCSFFLSSNTLENNFKTIEVSHTKLHLNPLNILLPKLILIQDFFFHWLKLMTYNNSTFSINVWL